MSKGKKASGRALGCRLNQYEALALEGKLKEAGYEIISFGDEADIGVINSCTVTREADAKSRNAIRRFIRKNPQAITVVVGCYSQMAANRIAMIDGVDFVIGNQDKLNFLDYLTEDKPETPVVVRERISREDFSIGFVGDTDFEQRANLKIQDGCDFMCSFCIIPFARGRYRDWLDLFEEASGMVQKGVREFILTGVNLGTYDSQTKDFLCLVKGLAELPGLDRLRISSIEPTTIPEQLFEMMSDPECPLMPYLHVPMQACCDRTLTRMRRKYGMDEMISFFDRAANSVSNLCLGTDLMVGFPGESESDFEETCENFLNLPFAYCHTFTFSEREGTLTAKMKDQVASEERRRRSAHLRRLSASKKMNFHEAQLDKEFQVLLENPKDGFYGEYTEHYVRVNVPQEPLGLENRMASVRMLKASPEFVEGTLLAYEEGNDVVSVDESANAQVCACP